MVRNKFSPLIIIDYGNNSVTVEGRLIIMNDDDFFGRLDKSFNILNDFNLIIDIEYFNTYSFKLVFLSFFNENIRSIQWLFEVDDEDTLAKGQIVKKYLESEDGTDVNFTFKKKKE